MNQLWIDGHEATFTKTAKQPNAANAANGGFQYTDRTTRKGETVWITYRGEQTQATVVRVGRKTVKLAFDGHVVIREYSELRKNREEKI